MIFLYFFATSRSNWWAAIPGCVLLSIGVDGRACLSWHPVSKAGWADLLYWRVSHWVSGWSICEFHANWWAIIPAGVMLTLASITLLNSENGMEYSGCVLHWPGFDICPGGTCCRVARCEWPGRGYLPVSCSLMGFLFISSAIQPGNLCSTDCHDPGRSCS